MDKGKNWGGIRPNQTGRPRKSPSQKRIDELLKVARAYTRKQGKSPEELLMDLVYAVGEGSEATLAQQYKALQTYFHQTMPAQKEIQQTITHNTEPAVALPEEDEDEGLRLVK